MSSDDFNFEYEEDLDLDLDLDEEDNEEDEEDGFGFLNKDSNANFNEDDMFKDFFAEADGTVSEPLKNDEELLDVDLWIDAAEVIVDNPNNKGLLGQGIVNYPVIEIIGITEDFELRNLCNVGLTTKVKSQEEGMVIPITFRVEGKLVKISDIVFNLDNLLRIKRLWSYDMIVHEDFNKSTKIDSDFLQQIIFI